MSIDGREQDLRSPVDGEPREHAERARLRNQMWSGLVTGIVLVVAGTLVARTGWMSPSRGHDWLWEWLWVGVGLVQLSEAWWARRALDRTPPQSPPPRALRRSVVYLLCAVAVVVAALCLDHTAHSGAGWGRVLVDALVVGFVGVPVVVNLPWADRWTMRPPRGA